MFSIRSKKAQFYQIAKCLCSLSLNLESLQSAKILALCGSSRKGSHNMKLLKAVSAMASDRKAADVTLVDMNEYKLPIFCEDTPYPEEAKELKKLFLEANGFIFACPEYNGTMTPLLNNTIAWMSKPEFKGESLYKAFKGKFALLVATSPGSHGGLRGLTPVAGMLGYMGTHVIANQVGVASSFHAFDDKGRISDEKTKLMLEDAVKELVELSRYVANRDSDFGVSVRRSLQAQFGRIESHVPIVDAVSSTNK